MTASILYAWHGKLIQHGKSRIRENKLNENMSRFKTDFRRDRWAVAIATSGPYMHSQALCFLCAAIFHIIRLSEMYRKFRFVR